ncbi:MAG: ATP-binding cassette domain-containing protein [Candidatus Promineifilaceae bacterium]
MVGEPVISAQNLSRRFGETVAVNDLSLEVYSGEIFGFLGHNGAGKTTTIRLLNGVLTADSGTVCVLGFSPQDQGPALRRHTGVLTETSSLEERLTARENLTIYADLYGVPKEKVNERVEEMLALFSLSDRADEKAGGYSKGMKQRLALARALLHDPEVIFLDEPTSGLDPVAAHRVHELILHLSRQESRTVFLCTHNLAEAQRLCHRVGVMENGHLVALGTPAELAQQWGHRLRLELEVAPETQKTALAWLQTLPGLTTSGEDGTIYVSGADRETVPDILFALINAGVRVYRASPQEPSLADVYFALHGEELAEGEEV